MAVLPKIQELLDQINTMKPYLDALGFKPNQANSRESLAALSYLYMTDFDKTMLSYDDVIMNGAYPVPIRIYIPNLNEKLPVGIFMHGGGHMSGSISVYNGVTRKLAKETNHIIVSIEYRLAPEFPYPFGIEDCKAVIRGLSEMLKARKINYKNNGLSILGDSAGGAICASMCMDKEFVAIHQIKKQVLIYPSVDYTGTSPSLDKFAEGYLLEKAKMQFYFANYFQNNEDPKKVSPLYGEFYANMPTTLVITAAYDPLCAEGIAYYNNLVNVGAQGELLSIEGVTHAYLLLEDLCKEECAKTYQEIDKFLHN